MSDEQNDDNGGNPALDSAKLLLMVVWLFAATGFVPPFSSWTSASLARPLFGILAITHLIEFFLFLNLYRKTGESLVSHFFATMSFGVLHYNEVKARLEG